MGRGGKKKGGGGDPESTPSGSQQPAQAEQAEEHGLTGPSKKRPNKKKGGAQKGNVDVPSSSSTQQLSSDLAKLDVGQTRQPKQGQPPLSQGGQPPFSQKGEPLFSQRGQPPFSQRGQPPFSQGGQPPLPQRGQPPFPQRGTPPFQQRGTPPFSKQGEPPYPQTGQLPMPQRGHAPWAQHGQQPLPQQGHPLLPQQGQQPLPQQWQQPLPQQGQPPLPQQGQAPWAKQGQPPFPQQGQHPLPQQSHSQQREDLPPQATAARPSPQQQPQKKQPPRSAAESEQQAKQEKAQTSAASSQQQDRRQVAYTECKYKIPLKIPGNTVRFKNLTVLANYMPLSITPMTVHRYDVIFEPVNPKKFYWEAVTIFMKKNFPNHLIAFDGMKNLFSAKTLKGVTGSDRYSDKVLLQDKNGRELKFDVSLKFTGAIDLNQLNIYMKSGTSLNPPAEAIQCLDVVLRQGRLREFVKAGRSFFMRPANPLDLGDGLEMWTGLFQSAIFTSKPYINIDVAHKGFPRAQTMLQLAQEFGLDTRSALDSRQNNRWAVEAFNDFTKNLKVMACVAAQANQKREFMVNSMSQPADKQTFTFTDANGKSSKMTVADYFLKEKGVRLKMPYMNCLWVGPRDKNIHFPLELCEVSYGQPRNKQLNERQLSKMVREAATKPDIRYAKIQEMIKKVNYRENEFYKEFGLKVTDEFIKVNAKQLDSPLIQYSDRTVKPAKGVWRMTRFFTSVPLMKWGIIGVECDMRSCKTEDLIRLFQGEGRKMGIEIGPPSTQTYGVPVNGLHSVMQEALRNQLQLLVVVLSRRQRDSYSKVKKIAETQVGVLTQCVKEETMQRFNPSTAGNILLKINSKLSGTNQTLAKPDKPACLNGLVMVVGADVTHPSPDQQNIPSIAAVTASIDPHCFKYNVCLSIQSPKKEMIEQFEEMMVDHLTVFKEKAGKLPQKLYIYRDGVSEGQFAQVLQYELTAVYEAFKRMGATTMPEVLFLLVQKRHHTRFFMGPKDPENVPPGTVVDKEIVHATELDFYLVSHAAIKGTARPTRYHCIRNESSLADDVVQQLTYYLCHLYSRCTRAVSYPAPTYYAHLACLRARALTKDERFVNADLERKPRRLNIMDSMLKTNPMFYV